MRLIDADALLEQIVKLNNVYVQGRMAYIIDNQPTAYDVEKVVAELENAHPINPYPNDFSNGRDMAIKNAIGIVRKGGVE